MDVTHGRPSALVTQQVSLDTERHVVIKRYLESRGGEAVREWRALGLLAEHAPRLAPEPISADLDARPPSLVMSLLPGEPLGRRPLAPGQERALAVAVGRLWQAVPAGLVASLPGGPDTRAEFVQLVMGWAAAPSDLVTGRTVLDALERGSAWLARAELSRSGTVGAGTPLVLGHGDADLANFLWDGELVRVVDFEGAGISDRAFELAMLVEHVSAWRDGGLDAQQFIEGFDLSLPERARLAEWRRMAALSWLLRLRSRGDPGLLSSQAERLLALL
ncbi:MAG TPA: aminoglycoside phosphotransferase family protein [Streptosporangiaceae bacterium]|nr:aminoglycoside phosphotransferase family protein [Streptosporangiaceae bacterium]